MLDFSSTWSDVSVLFFENLITMVTGGTIAIYFHNFDLNRCLDWCMNSAYIHVQVQIRPQKSSYSVQIQF